MRRLFTNDLEHRLSYRLPLLILLLGLSIMLAAPKRVLAASFTVNSTGDTVDATPGNGICADAGNACTLRAAIMEANALAGADIITLPAGTFTLSRAGSDDNATNGDLDVTGPLTLNGNSQATTILQAGTTNSNGIDKIFSFNPVGNFAGFAVSLANLTLRFGRNPETYANNNGFGGCFDFDAGTNAAAPGSLTLNSVTITDCSTTDADGGGVALFLNKGGTVNISNTTIQNNKAGINGNATSGLGGGIFFGTTDAGSTINVTLNNSTISNNQALGGAKQGGGLFIFGGAATYNYQFHTVTIAGNSAASDGGGIYSTAPLVIDQASVISNNSSGRSGGGIWLNHANRTSTITGVTISGNQASDGGGGIRLDSGTPANNLTLSFSRIVGNTAGSGKGSGLSVNNGVATAINNWWGCSTGPSAAPCDTAQVDPASGGTTAGTGSVNFTPWLRVSLTAATSPLVTGQSTGLTASFLTNSNGGAVSLSNLSVLLGLPVTWGSVGGTISGQQATVQASGTATASYQATAAAAGNRAVAKVDNDSTTTGSNVLNLTVNKANTSATITADTPDPSAVGQAVTVSYNVTVNAPGAGTATGNVTVSDGVDSCIGTVAAGSCNLTLTTVGARTLTATYAGDANFNGSTSAGVPHTVKETTTTAITADNPDPSVVGQSVTVQYSVTPQGAGTPTGNVTVSDGTLSCTATVAAGQCSLTFTTPGAKTLTATYAGDANFSGSTSAGAAHTVNKADTTTAITADTPDPSTVGQGVTVSYNVVINASGAGTATGSVTVSDGVDSCTATVADGQCTITLTTTGARTLTATYAGDANFNGSTSTGEAHTVNPATQAPQITSQPGNQNVCAGATASFSAAASGDPVPTVQWQVSTDNGATWNDLSGETNATLSVVTSAADTGKQYRAVFTNSAGSATSNAASLTVNSAPAITTQPTNQTVNAGQSVSFSAAASGSPAPTVQWQVSTDNGATWSDLSGETNATLTFTAQSSDNGKQYRAIFTNVCGTATSNAATLTVNTLPPPDTTAPDTTINSQPANPSNSSSASFTFSGTDNVTPPASLTFECSLDSAAFAACSSPQNYSGLADGSHTFQVRAKDVAGNVDATPASYTWTIQTGGGNTFIASCGGYDVYRTPQGQYTAAGWSGVIKVGTNSGNTLKGSAGPDLILGLGGNDSLKGEEGADILCGGDGVDLVLGQAGNDYLEGGKGSDVLNGGKGDYDQLLAGEGADALLDGDGVSSAQGGPGNDVITFTLRNGWRDQSGQARFAGLAAGYGNDTVGLAILGSTTFLLDITGDERDNPASPLEGTNDVLALGGVIDPASSIIKFETQIVVAAEESTLTDESGAELLSEPVGEEEQAQRTIFLSVVLR